MLCGYITSKGTPCKLNKNNCRYHKNTVPTVPDRIPTRENKQAPTVPENIPVETVQPPEVSRRITRKNSSAIPNDEKKDHITAVVVTKWLFSADETWSYDPVKDSYFFHVKVYSDCDDTTCTMENKDCIVYCLCSGCDAKTRTQTDHSANMKNFHCVYCRCKSCVCPARRVNGKYTGEYPAKYSNPCRGICATCARYTPY